MSFNNSILKTLAGPLRTGALPRLLSLALLMGFTSNVALAWGPLALPKDFEKKYSETFAVDGSGTVRLENRYGEIRVETWTRDEVKIDVVIRVSADDQEEADDTFDRIRIDFVSSGNSAAATTNIGDRSRKGGGWFRDLVNGNWGWNNNSSNDFKVYYSVKMPAAADLTTTAKYCDVTLPDLSGETNLSIGYGDLFAGDLTGPRNNVTVSYGSARISTLAGRSELRVRYSEGSINEAGDLRYDGRYSDFRLGTVGELNLDIGYEDVEIESAAEIRMDGNYNDVEVEKVGTLIVDGNYNEWSVGVVEKELEVESSYGDFEVDRLASGFTRVYVRTSYIDVEIDVDGDAGYDLDLRTRYGDISYDRERARNVNTDRNGSSRTVIASVPGKGSGKIDISTSYGDIEIN